MITKGNEMRYKVVIPSAGVGSRLDEHCNFINKTLVPVANRPIISYILDKFDRDVEIVIALGYKGDLIKQFLKLAYPERKITFVDVDPYEGPDSGLGYTLLSCKDELQCPFVFFPNDTIVSEQIPLPDHNWMGYADMRAGNDYRSVTLDTWDQTVAKGLNEKGVHPENNAYIGICGVADYKKFWSLMEDGKDRGSIQRGESYALEEMMQDSIVAKRFTWLDTGTIEALDYASERLKSEDDPVILPKKNEHIWFCNNKVIKFSTDQRFIGRRVLRSGDLQGYVPTIIDSTENMYCYELVDGEIMSKAASPTIFKKLLGWLENLWTKKAHITGFEEMCKSFYFEKTMGRVNQYFKRFDRKDTAQTINDIRVPSLGKILSNLDWGYVLDGSPVRFHGDLHFENILYIASEDNFCLLDWREEFAGSLDVGDIYYDFAKLLHGFIISHELINKDLYNISGEGDVVKFDFLRKHSALWYEEYLKDYVVSRGYDWKKVQILTALIFLNISPLHHQPYADMLFHLGKLQLHLLMEDSNA